MFKLTFWDYYLLAYTFIAFIYLWYRYIYLLSHETSTQGNYYGKTSIVIPFYNERPDLLERTLRSAHECYGDNEIIVVDDGSTDLSSYNKMQELQKEFSFKLIRYEINKGKRHAQGVAFRQATGDIIVTLDSDTLLDKKAIVELIRPFSIPNVGATTGQMEALNGNTNLLTKMQQAKYWNAFNLERKSQSKFGALVCCSGCLSAYRTDLIMSLIDDYENQYFLGQKCTYGDDRHLTTLILKRGHDVKYVKEAVGYTDVPETWKKFTKQQTRWKKSWLRETYLVSKFMFQRSKALSFEIMITAFLTIFSVFARIMLIVSLIKSPEYALFVVPMLLVMTSLHSLYILFHKPKYFIYSLIYGFVHVFYTYWLIFVAFFTFRNTGWGTR